MTLLAFIPLPYVTELGPEKLQDLVLDLSSAVSRKSSFKERGGYSVSVSIQQARKPRH